ncbi:hypothetical protein EAE96_000116 [Botrytis aclada]|nr:hypothetical protein EAE96_000116 [Botrytis aclada]
MAREDNPDFLAPRDMLIGDRFVLDKDSYIESIKAVEAFHSLSTSWDGLINDFLGHFPYRIYHETRFAVEQLYTAIQPLPGDWDDRIMLDIRGMLKICYVDIHPIATDMEKILVEIEAGSPLNSDTLQNLDTICLSMKAAASSAAERGQKFNQHVDDFVRHHFEFQPKVPFFEDAAASLVGERIRLDWGFKELRRLAALSHDGLKGPVTGLQLMEGIWQNLIDDLNYLANLIAKDETQKSLIRIRTEKKISKKWKKLKVQMNSFQGTLEQIVGSPQPDWEGFWDWDGRPENSSMTLEQWFRFWHNR